MSESKVLLQGSLAYDRILKYPLRFNSILDLQKEYISSTFVCNELKFCFGGCAGNIAYGLKQLDCSFDMYGYLGSQDANSYLDYLKGLDISSKNITLVEGSNSANAFIVGDNYDQQMVFFFPGPVITDPILKFKSDNYAMAFIAPNSSRVMEETLNFALRSNLPVWFDGGHQLQLLHQEIGLKKFLESAAFVFVNRNEFELMEKLMEFDLPSSLPSKTYLVVTDSANPIKIYQNNKIILCTEVEKIEGVSDPTGAGDALRAGFVTSYLNSSDLSKAVNLGMKLASRCILHSTPQGY